MSLWVPARGPGACALPEEDLAQAAGEALLVEAAAAAGAEPGCLGPVRQRREGAAELQRLRGHGCPVALRQGRGLGRGVEEGGADVVLAEAVQQVGGAAGVLCTDGVAAVLAIVDGGLRKKPDLPAGRGQQGEIPVVHQHGARVLRGTKEVRERTVQGHGTAGDDVLHQQLIQPERAAVQGGEAQERGAQLPEVPVHDPEVRVDEGGDGGVRTELPEGGDGLLGLVRMPDVVLVAEEQVRCVAEAAQQVEKVALRIAEAPARAVMDDAAGM